MKNRKFVKYWLFSLLSLLFFGLFNFIIDPLHQYRINTFYPVKFDQDRYKNAGFLKHYEYDSIVLGTSTSQNFVLSEVDDILNFNKSLKLTLSGGSAKEQSVILSSAIKNKKIKNILWGLDFFSFQGYPDRLRNGRGSFPYYLYDNNFLNDYRYLISFDTIKLSFNLIKDLFSNDYSTSGSLFDYNQMYQWQTSNNKDFTKENFIKNWLKRDIEFNIVPQEQQKIEYLRESFNNNFLNILEENKNINFIIFFPPYSILKYCYLKEKNTLIDYLEFKKYIVEKLSQYENIKIYDFSTSSEVTMDLFNYKDLIHYHQKINTWIIKQIEQKANRIDKNNINLFSEKLFQQVEMCREFKENMELTKY